MNKVDILRKHIGNDDFYDMNGTSMLSDILNVMEEYAQKQVKNCSIPYVVGQSEQFYCASNEIPKFGILEKCDKQCDDCRNSQ